MTFKFGDRVENPHASDSNPQRRGFFVETIIRKGPFNPGRWGRVTDGAGKFWEVPIDCLEDWTDIPTEEE